MGWRYDGSGIPRRHSKQHRLCSSNGHQLQACLRTLLTIDVRIGCHAEPTAKQNESDVAAMRGKGDLKVIHEVVVKMVNNNLSFSFCKMAIFLR
jgi:hypothetical protein